MSGRSRPVLFSCALAVLASALPAAAQLRTETLRWQDTQNSRSELTGYRIHFGSASRTYLASVTVPLPPVSGGIMQTSIQVPATGKVYFAITALKGELESFYSNEICREGGVACTSEPSPTEPTPTEPPPSDGASAAITGFKLWNAQTDTVIDGDFRSGERITLSSTGDCVAIEIVGNSYLQDDGPGSVMKAFDGNTPSACNNPGVTHENSAPFAWEADQGPNLFGCAASLIVPGTHELLVVPFDEDNCNGAVGAPVRLTFEVVGDSTSSTQEPLGQPGQPKLIP